LLETDEGPPYDVKQLGTAKIDFSDQQQQQRHSATTNQVLITLTIMIDQPRDTLYHDDTDQQRGAVWRIRFKFIITCCSTAPTSML